MASISHTLSPSQMPERQRLHLAQWLVTLVELRFGLPKGHLTLPGRGNMRSTEARQLAAYLIHTSLGLPLRHTADILRRHRSTIAHSLREVERRRDDPLLDEHVEALHAHLSTLSGVLLAETAQ